MKAAGITLKTAYRYIRATAAGLKPAIEAMGWCDAIGFVQALLARYRGRLERRWELGLTFRRPMPVQAVPSAPGRVAPLQRSA